MEFLGLAGNPPETTHLIIPKTEVELKKEGQEEAIFERLVEWRLQEWETNWTGWVMYGPENVVSDEDLKIFSKKLREVRTTDDIWNLGHIPHFPIVAPQLLGAIQEIAKDVYGPGPYSQPAPSRISPASRLFTKKEPSDNIPPSISISGINMGAHIIADLIPKTWPVHNFEPIQSFANETSLTTDDARQGQKMSASLSRWFITASDEEFVGAISDACKSRGEIMSSTVENSSSGQASRPPSGFLFSSSDLIYEAVCVARTAFVNNISLEVAEERVKDILGTATPIHHPNESIRIILKLRNSREEHKVLEEYLRRASYLRQEDLDASNYHKYLRLLHLAVERQIAAKLYTDVILVSHDEPYISVLTKVINVVRKSVGAEKRDQFPHLLSNVSCIPCFGGLSNSQVSIAATKIAAEKNVESSMKLSLANLAKQGGAFRLKINYLEKIIRERVGSVYDSLSKEKQAVLFIHELDRFSQAHPSLELITLENLQDYELTKCLQAMIGSGGIKRHMERDPWPGEDSFVVPHKFLFTYVDTPDALQTSQTQESRLVVEPHRQEMIKIADFFIKDAGRIEDSMLEVQMRELNRAYQYFKWDGRV